MAKNRPRSLSLTAPKIAASSAAHNGVSTPNLVIISSGDIVTLPPGYSLNELKTSHLRRTT
jgi:hypothetical protein